MLITGQFPRSGLVLGLRSTCPSPAPARKDTVPALGPASDPRADGGLHQPGSSRHGHLQQGRAAGRDKGLPWAQRYLVAHSHQGKTWKGGNS